jgi:predicted acylesterase/phospholipase RssA
MPSYLLSTIVAALAGQVAADKCYAAAFSSGDESAAYQAGVLKGLIAQNGPELHAYSAVSGMSGGAVNAAILGSFPVGKEAAAADRMV